MLDSLSLLQAAPDTLMSGAHLCGYQLSGYQIGPSTNPPVFAQLTDSSAAPASKKEAQLRAQLEEERKQRAEAEEQAFTADQERLEIYSQLHAMVARGEVRTKTCNQPRHMRVTGRDTFPSVRDNHTLI